VMASRGIEITTKVEPIDWDAFVASCPTATGYHRWSWRRVFENAFGHEAVYLAAVDAGEIVGILPMVVFRSALFGRFAVSLPFVNYGGVCARDSEVAALLVEQAAAIAADARLAHVELRHTNRQLPALPARQHKVGMHLSLAARAEDAWNAFDRKVRNQIRKAEKSGLVVSAAGAESLRPFYDVFARNMRDLGTPVYSIRFFEEVLATFPEGSRVFLVEQGADTIGAAIALIHGDTLEVPWASSLREYRSLCPNNLLYWRIIEYAIEKRLATFDFGRSTPNEGTFEFKKQWGARPFPLYWEYILVGDAALPDMSPGNPRFRAAVAAWKRLPISVTNWAGPHIVRSIP
jgi:FemAB-related protein (PEP-CTERM system-associated)